MTPIPPIDSERWVSLSYQQVSHAKSVTQTRLYNFLMAASIVFLAWATLHASAPDGLLAAKVMTTISGLLLSGLYFIVGRRSARFMEEGWDIAYELAEGLKKTSPKVANVVLLNRALQKDGKITLSDKRKIILSPTERALSSRAFLYLVPGLMCATFFISLILSLK